MLTEGNAPHLIANYTASTVGKVGERNANSFIIENGYGNGNLIFKMQLALKLVSISVWFCLRFSWFPLWFSGNPLKTVDP